MPDVIEVNATTGVTTARDFTAEERAVRTAAAAAAAEARAIDLLRAGNEATIRDAALAALETNATHLARTAPTTAQNTAQIKSLTRQNNGIIRLILGQLDATD